MTNVANRIMKLLQQNKKNLKIKKKNRVYIYVIYLIKIRFKNNL